MRLWSARGSVEFVRFYTCSCLIKLSPELYVLYSILQLLRPNCLLFRYIFFGLSESFLLRIPLDSKSVALVFFFYYLWLNLVQCFPGLYPCIMLVVGVLECMDLHAINHSWISLTAWPCQSILPSLDPVKTFLLSSSLLWSPIYPQDHQLWWYNFCTSFSIMQIPALQQL